MGVAGNEARIGPIDTVEIAATRTEWLDVARGISILLVVLFHTSIALGDNNLLSPVYWKINNFFVSMRMPVFFCVSGILLSLKMDFPIIQILRMRVFLLWYLYALWTAIHFAFASFDNSPIPALQNWLVAIVDPHPLLWFLWALGFYGIVARMSPVGARPVILMIATGITCLTPPDAFGPAGNEQHKALIYLPFFLAGAWFPSWFKWLADRPILVGIPAATLLVLLYWSLQRGLLWHGFDTLKSVSGLIFGIAVAVCLLRLSVAAHVLKHLGRNTLAIYLAHVPLLAVGIPIVIAAASTGLPAATIWAAPLSGAIAIVLSLVLRKLLDRAGARFFYELPWPRFRRSQLQSSS